MTTNPSALPLPRTTAHNIWNDTLAAANDQGVAHNLRHTDDMGPDEAEIIALALASAFTYALLNGPTPGTPEAHALDLVREMIANTQENGR